LPAVQLLQSQSPAACWKVPAAQLLQALWAAGVYVPAAQATHAPADGEPVAAL